MKIVDLIIKIANKEEVPYKIKYNGNIYEFSEETQNYLRPVNLGLKFLINEDIIRLLNDEVEIIEEDKEIEKIEIVNNGNMNAYAIYSADGTKCALTKHSKVMCDKINELIDKVNSLKNKQ